MRWLIGIGAVVVVLLAFLLFRSTRHRDGAGDHVDDAHGARAGGARGGDAPEAAGRPSTRPLPRPGGGLPPAPSAGGDSTPRPSLPPGDPGAGDGPVFAPGTPLPDQVKKVRDTWFARDYEHALAAAEEVLQDNPTEARSLWVAVASACMMGDADKAQTYFDRVRVAHNPERAALAQRCRDAGVDLDESRPPPPPPPPAP